MKYQINIFIFLTLLLISCGNKTQVADTGSSVMSENEVNMTDAQLNNASLESGKLIKQVLHTQIKLNGTVDIPPQNIVSVSFPMGGYLKTTSLIPGMNIRKGAVIATIEDPSLVQLQQDYLMAKVKLELLEKEFQRQSILREANVNATKIFQQAVADFESQKVMVKGLEEKLKLAGIQPEVLTAATISRSVLVRSPITGFVSKVNVNIGKYVTPSDVLFEIINPDDVHAALTVFEKDLGSVKIGQKVKVSFVNAPDKTYDCEVILVTQNVTEEGTSTIHCHFETKPLKLLPGMFLTANLIREDSSVLSIQEEGVVRSGNQLLVVEVIGKGRFKMVPIKETVRENGWVGIESENLDENKIYVTKNAYSVFSKLKNTAEE